MQGVPTSALRRLISVIAIPCLFVSAVTAQSPRTNFEEWRRVGSTKDDNVYFQLKSVSLTKGGIVKAWVRYQFKRTPTEQLDEYLTIHKTPDYFDAYKYGYFLELEEFKCSERRSRTTSRLRYDYHGEYLSGTQSQEGAWVDVAPDTIGERVLDGVCDYYYAQLDDFFKDVPPAKPKPKPVRPSRRARH